MSYLDPQEAFEHFSSKVVESVRQQFPVKGRLQTLHLENLDVRDVLHPDDIRSQQKAKAEGSSWAVPLYGTFVLKDNLTGKTVEKRTVRIADIPKMTKRYSYIVGGQEYQVDSQWQLKPGAYARRRQNGQLEVQFNCNGPGSKSFDMLFSPEKRQFQVEWNKAKIPAYPILSSMGVTDAQLQKAWGVDILEANKHARGVDGALASAFRSDKGRNPLNEEEAKEHVWATLLASKMNADSTRRTLGHAHESVTGDALLTATSRILSMHQGGPEDDRDSLIYKRLRSVGDFAQDKIGGQAWQIRNKMLRKVDTATTIRDVVKSEHFNFPIIQTFHKNQAARVASQINPLEMVSGNMQTTIRGPGGIQSEHGIVDETKFINSSHFGFLDPINTPEGPTTGVSLRLPLGVQKVGDEPRIQLYSLKTHKMESVSPADLVASKLLLPDQVTWKNGKPQPVGPKVKMLGAGNDLMAGKFGDADYVMRHATQVFNITSNMIPFLHSTSGNRAGMAARHLEQAVSLEHREAPLVQVATGAELGPRTFEEMLGQQTSHSTPVSGKVVSIGRDRIIVQAHDGKRHEVQLYDNYPLNDPKAVLHSTAVVRVGDAVHKGQHVADTNFTRNGTLALGTNLRSVTADTLVFWWDNGKPMLSAFGEILPVANMQTCTVQPHAPFAQELLPVQAFITHQVTEDVVRVKTVTGRSVCATVSHSFVVFAEGGLAEHRPTELVPGLSWLPRIRYIKIPEVLHEVSMCSAQQKRVQPLSVAFGRLLGFYLAEGHAVKAHVTIAASDAYVQQQVVEAAAAAGFGKAVVRATTVTIYSAVLARHLRCEAGHLAQNKKLPSYVLGADERFRKAVLGAYWAGDGTVVRQRQTVEVTASTASLRLRDGLALLCASLRIDTTLTDYAGSLRPDGSRYKHCWKIRIASRDLHAMPEIPHTEKEQRIRKASAATAWDEHDMIPLWAGVLPELRKAVLHRFGSKAANSTEYSFWSTCRSRMFAPRSRLIELLRDVQRTPLLGLLYSIACNDDVAWDRVASVTPVPYSGLVYDFDMGRNPNFSVATGLVVHNTAYMPYKGYNFDDGIVISESAAKKMSSVHLAKPSLMLDDQMVLDPKKFRPLHPGTYKTEQYEKLGADGIVRVGQHVRPGDPLVLATTPFQLQDRVGIAAIRKSLSGAHTDKSLKWESDAEGEVVGTHRKDSAVYVHVKTVEPMVAGDKLAGRHGNKGICVSVLPDTEMPRSRDGKHIEVLLNPIGVPGRINVGQIFETVAGKIALKTGKPYVVRNFEPGVDQIARIKQEARQHGISDTEELFDPESGLSYGHVQTGPLYMTKQVHQVAKKGSVRSGMTVPGSRPEHYDNNLVPAGGGHTGGQSIGSLGLYALLAHGAKANIREMQTWKSEGADPQTNEAKKWKSQHTEVWKAIQNGTPLPPPTPTFAFKKFTDYMQAAGINMEKQGHTFVLSPITDKQIEKMSSGALPHPDRKLSYKLNTKGEPLPVHGGLFDERFTGGHGGTKWCHIELAEPVPNPVFEKPIKSLTGLRQKEFDALVAGQMAVTMKGELTTDTRHGIVGGAAIEHLLKKIDVEKGLKAARQDLETAAPAKVDAALKRVKYLEALHRTGMAPHEAYILHKLPILPPVMRPATTLPNGTINEADLNGLYADFGQINKKMGDPIMAELTNERKEVLRTNYYDGVRAIMGVGVPYGDQKQKGLLHQLAGSAPKEGYFQNTLMNRRQDLTMRSTIVPEPALGLDEVGLPRQYAMTLFRPFVVRHLQMTGVPAISGPGGMGAQEMIAKNDPLAQKMLERVVESKSVLLKRDPVLHKFGIMGFRPKLVEGSAIRVHPLVTSGFNADFDGDTMSVYVPISHEAEAEVRKMMPSNNLFANASGKVMFQPKFESALGLYRLTRITGQSDKKFGDPGQAVLAAKNGKLSLTELVDVKGVGKTTAGRIMVAAAMPKSMQHRVLTDQKLLLSKKGLDGLLSEMAHLSSREGVDKDCYAKHVNLLKDVGNGAATGLAPIVCDQQPGADALDPKQRVYMQTGAHTLSLSDLEPDRRTRDAALRHGQKKVDEINGMNITAAAKERRTVEVWTAADRNMQAAHNMRVEAGGKPNNLYMLRAIGKPSDDQYKQLVLAPMLVKDTSGRTIPTPITKSFSEGQDVSDYWIGMYGARRGAVRKVQEVQEPGVITKMMQNTAMDMLIAGHDCGTDKGVALSVNDKSVHDRHLATAFHEGKLHVPAGTILSPDVVGTIRAVKKDAQLLVRSPLKCQHEHGICQKCMGLSADGRHYAIGYNVGVEAAHAHGERTMQLMLNTFHSGGVAGTKKGAGDEFEAFEDLVKLPEVIPGQASIAMRSGKIDSIRHDKLGAWVTVGGHEHFVGKDRNGAGLHEDLPYAKEQINHISWQPPRVGTVVQAGQFLSDPNRTVINPRQLYDATGNIDAVQNHLTKEIHGIFGKEGLDRRQSELLVKTMTSTTRVTNPGDHPDLLRGEYRNTSWVRAQNALLQQQGRRPILHQPELKGIDVLPLSMREDWMAKLQHRHLRDTILEAAATGGISDLHGTHPIPGIAYGVEFGYNQTVAARPGYEKYKDVPAYHY